MSLYIGHRDLWESSQVESDKIEYSLLKLAAEAQQPGRGENVPDSSSPWSLMKPVAGQVRSLGTYSSQHPLPGGQSEAI